jgi:hypothetical protein
MSNITRAVNPHLLVDENAGTLTVSDGVLDANGDWIDVTVRGCNPSFLAQVRAGTHPTQRSLAKDILEAWQKAMDAARQNPTIQRLAASQSLDADRISFLSYGRSTEIEFPGSDQKGKANAAFIPSVASAVEEIRRTVMGFTGVAHGIEGSPGEFLPSSLPKSAPDAASPPPLEAPPASSQRAVVPAAQPLVADPRPPAPLRSENFLDSRFQEEVYKKMRPNLDAMLRRCYQERRFPFDDEKSRPREELTDIVDYFLHLPPSERARIAKRLRNYPRNSLIGGDRPVHEYLLAARDLARSEGSSVPTHEEALWYLIAPLLNEMNLCRQTEEATAEEMGQVIASIFRALGLREGFLPEERPRSHRAIGWGDVASFLLMLALAGADHFMRRRLFGL